MKKSFYSILLLCLALVFFCSPAFAGTTAAYSEANLNLDEFATKFNLFTTGPFTWSGYTTSTYAEAQIPPLSLITTDSGTTSSTASLINAGAPYFAKGDVGQSSTLTLKSTSKTGPEATFMPYATSIFSGSGSWVYNGAGESIDFSTPYTQVMKLVADSGATYASGTSYVWFDFTGTNGVSAYFFREVVNGQVSTNNPGQTPFFSVDFDKGDKGTLEFGVMTDAKASAVPIPAALWLLGSGLIGLVGYSTQASVDRKIKYR